MSFQMVEVAEGVQYIHSEGIAHGNLHGVHISLCRFDDLFNCLLGKCPSWSWISLPNRRYRSNTPSRRYHAADVKFCRTRAIGYVQQMLQIRMHWVWLESRGGGKRNDANGRVCFRLSSLRGAPPLTCHIQPLKMIHPRCFSVLCLFKRKTDYRFIGSLRVGHVQPDWTALLWTTASGISSSNVGCVTLLSVQQWSKLWKLMSRF